MLPTNKIICGDCVEVMADWPGGCVDAVVTDPPWKASASRMVHRRPGDGRGVADARLSTSLQYGDIGYFDAEVIKQMCRVSVADVLVLCGYIELCEVLEAIGRVRGVFVWHNTRPTPLPGPVRRRNVAFVVWGGVRTQVSSANAWDSCLFAHNSPQAGCFATERILNSDGTTAHPAQEPLGLFEDIVKPLQGVILDPYCGSGTTCVAAKKLGRRYIGIDISPEYCAIARKRLEAVETGVPAKEAEKGQMALFQGTENE